MTFRKTVPKSPKKTLVELLSTKEVIHELKEQEKRQKEFEESVEDELRNGGVM